MDRTINELTESGMPSPAFICISGDNYYPDISKSSDGVKTKTLSIPDLQSGFKCLSEFQKRHHGIPIDIITGNHDIENTTGMKIIPAASAVLSESHHNECLITETEIASTIEDGAINMNLTMFNYRVIQNTLIIMIDSNIYCESLTGSELKCYALLVHHTRSKLNLKLNESVDETRSTLTLTPTVVDLKRFQENWLDMMYKSIAGIRFSNIVIVAHHPIAMYKIKNKECKFHTTSDEYLNFCYSIYSRLKGTNGAQHFFYSCADLHTYQAGIVTLRRDDIDIIIQQEIAGTGGTALEEEAAISSCAIADNSMVNYSLTHAVHSYGFLHWSIDRGGRLIVRFISIDSFNESSRGGTKRRKRKQVASKRRKRKQRTYKRLR